MKKRFIILTLVGAVITSVLMPAASGPSTAHASEANSQSHAHPAFFEKTRFLLHMGLAYGAFHHWVWKPYRAGAFKQGAHGRTKALIKAGLALLFAAHEAKVSYDIAKDSDSKTLHTLIAPIRKLQATLGAIGSRFKKGNFSDASVNGLNRSVNAIDTTAKKGGYDIIDRFLPGGG